MEPNHRESKTLGANLAEAMRLKGINTERLAAATGISERWITLILGDHRGKLPAAPYLHGYLIKIGEALGVDGEALWREHLAGEPAVPRSGADDRMPEAERAPIIGRRGIVFGTVILAVLTYISFHLPSLFGRPDLSLDFEDNTVVATSTFTVSGSADPDNKVTVNGELAYPNDEKRFSKTITLAPGENTVTVVVEQLLGARREIVRTVIFETSTASGVVQ